jgi:hypothetical protein
MGSTSLWSAKASGCDAGDDNTSTSFLLGFFAIIALSSPLQGGGDFCMCGLDNYFAQW